MKSLVLTVFFSLAIAGCDESVGPALEISDAAVFAALPGTRAAVGYMTIRNNSRTDIVITSISSPQFASISVHETKITDGVARMTMLRSLLVPARSALVLGDGGLHIMLMDPLRAVGPDQPVSLHFNYDVAGLVIVSTTVQSRFDHDTTG
ncbi:MAG: copper chaperone PCu(A)C [Gammaproteobacteria bacterium]|nr:copper chaperone PCu(A)C [Gammaproteobacteria bacterium]